MITGLIQAAQIEKYAEGLINEYGTTDPLRIARAEGFRLYHKELGGLLGFYCRMLGTDVICLNSSLSDDVSRLVAAHELGHGLLHCDAADRTVLPELTLWDMLSQTEYEANAFASHLLIPTESLLQRLGELSYEDGCTADSPSSLAAYFGCDVNLLLIKVKELRRMGMKLKLPFNPDTMFLSSL
ncbi:MAG: ImmA/IrrE family metallo-endopeptidase [Clostridia bacterium]|nr:ImmA/IrrE family metallo-endopeptidase [Clostridia bacterium]